MVVKGFLEYKAKEIIEDYKDGVVYLKPVLEMISYIIGKADIKGLEEAFEVLYGENYNAYLEEKGDE